MAAIDVSLAQAEVIGQVAAVVSVGMAVLLVWVALSAFRNIRDALGGDGGGDPWDGYDAQQDAKDRAAAAMDAVYARASAMAAAGEGQSEDFGHNTAGAAWEAGYAGRVVGDTMDPAAQAAWEQGRLAAQEDSDAAHDEFEAIQRGEH